jgi:hypothetical protein
MSRESEHSASPVPANAAATTRVGIEAYDKWKKLLDERQEGLRQTIERAGPPAALENMLAEIMPVNADGSLNPLGMPENSRDPDFIRYQELVLYGASRLRSILAVWPKPKRSNDPWVIAFDRELVSGMHNVSELAKETLTKRDLFAIIGEATVLFRTPMVPRVVTVLAGYWNRFRPRIVAEHLGEIMQEVRAQPDDLSRAVGEYTNQWWKAPELADLASDEVSGFRLNAKAALKFHKDQVNCC